MNATPNSVAAGTKEALHYLGAIKVRLELLYEHSTQDSRLLEHLSDEVDWVDAEIERLRSADVAQGQPGCGEPVAFVPLTQDGRPQWAETFAADDGCYIDYPEKWRPLYATSQTPADTLVLGDPVGEGVITND